MWPEDDSNVWNTAVEVSPKPFFGVLITFQEYDVAALQLLITDDLYLKILRFLYVQRYLNVSQRKVRRCSDREEWRILLETKINF